MNRIELLEARIAPAILLTISADHKTATWVDVDGDQVTLKASKPVLNPEDFTFLADQGGDLGAQLAHLDLRDIGDAGKGVNLTFTAKRNHTTHLGDGTVHVGRIEATGMDLGTIVVNGDLGSIFAGDATLSTPAVKSITALSSGHFKIETQATQAVTGDAPNLGWVFHGKVGTITIKGSSRAMIAAVADLSGGGSPVFDANYSIGKIIILGDLIGDGAAFAPTANYGVGSILVAGNISTIKIGGDLNSNFSPDYGAGSVQAYGSIAKITVGGNLIGGSGDASGTIFGGKSLGNVLVQGNVSGGNTLVDSNGNVDLDGANQPIFTFAAGAIGGGSIGTVKIVGNLAAGYGKFCGAIYTVPGMGGDIKSVSIGGTFSGHTFLRYQSGSLPYLSGIYADGQIGSVTVREIDGDFDNPAPIAALGTPNPKTAAEALAIKSVTIKNWADGALIVAGFDFSYAARNPHVQIGSVKVALDFSRSSIAAGIFDPSGDFGADTNVLIQGSAGYQDSTIRSKIINVNIGTYIRGIGSTSYTNGIVAQDIGSVHLGKTALELFPSSRDLFGLGLRGGFFVREVGA